MGTFDIRTDAPGLLRAESVNITLTFDRTSPTTGRISWNIPAPAAGCTAENQAYDGMIVTIDTTPASVDKVPTNTKIYTADPTADPNLFAGDKLGTSFVIGAFYGDKTTTFFDISGLKPNTPYYVTGFPVDAQYRYYIEGVHAYSMDLTNRGGHDTNGHQSVLLNAYAKPIGRQPTDATGLLGDAVFTSATAGTATAIMNVTTIISGGPLAVGQQLTFAGQVGIVTIESFSSYSITSETGTIILSSPQTWLAGVSVSVLCTYTFTIKVGIDPPLLRQIPNDRYTDFRLPSPTYTITILGADAQTYQDLVNAINIQLSMLNGVVQAPIAPNTGTYVWDAATQTLSIWDGSTLVLVSNTIVQPTQPNLVNVGTYWLDTTTNTLKIYNGVSWDVVPTIIYTANPTAPLADETYWFDGTTGYLWNGEAWCEVLTYVQATDPSLAPIIPAGSYWFDTVNGVLYRWNDTLEMWNTVTAVQSDVDPNYPVGAYWFNETTNLLYSFNSPNPGWNLQPNLSISETAPTTPSVGKYWYKPTEVELFQWDGLNWLPLDVIAFPTDPTQRGVCDLWWNTATAELSVWDAVHSTWRLVTSLYQQGIDPTIPLAIAEGTLWYDTTNSTLNVWHNNCFTPVPFIYWATDPNTSIPAGTAWYNPTTDAWSVISQPGNVWTVITPTTSLTDPTVLPAGTFWFDTSTDVLQQWNGINWISVAYTTTAPIPAIGDLWFNTTTNTLEVWNGTAWVTGTPVATCELDPGGNLLFTDTTFGSMSAIFLTDQTLFLSLSVPTVLHDSIIGSDGASDEPAYQEVGIGTDGTADERLTLANEIRYELGYPNVDVELTPQQIDYAITKALSELRAKSSAGYKKAYYFMRIVPEIQHYFLTNKTIGMNRITDVLGVFRITSSFMSSAAGAGVYGQIILQQLYNMGTFDLLSYHIMAEYQHLMEILFSARVTYTWNEQTRELFLLHRFALSEETVAIEAAVERTEQDLLIDRYMRPWLRRYSLATCRLILAETRGKFSTLPGASGSVTLNATELRQAAATEIELLLFEIENYVADRPEEWSRSDIIFG